MRLQIKNKAGETVFVRAKRFGLLAVHRSYYYYPAAGDLFTVSHIPTGLAVRSGIPKTIALELASQLQPLDWNFKRKASAKRLKPSVLPIFRKLGLV